MEERDNPHAAYSLQVPEITQFYIPSKIYYDVCRQQLSKCILHVLDNLCNCILAKEHLRLEHFKVTVKLIFDFVCMEYSVTLAQETK